MLKQWLNKRAVVLVVGILAVAALVALSAGFASFEFDAALVNEVRFEQAGEEVLVTRAMPELPWVSNIIMFVSALLCAAFIISLFDPEMRKWLRKRLPYMLVIIALLLAFSRLQKAEVPPEAASATETANTTTTTDVDQQFVPPQISLLGAFVTVLAGFLIIMALAYYAWMHRPVRRPPVLTPLEELGGIVQATLHDLDAGRDWEDAIVQCYVRMSETVNVERGLQRQQAMTPSEFAARLIRAGLPAAAVDRLTQLFEAVRYGAKPSTRAEVDEAVACLRAIVDACGGAA